MAEKIEPDRPPSRKKRLDLTELEDTFGYLVRTLQVRSFRAFDEAFAKEGLTPARHAILTIIRFNPGVRQVQIASLMGLHEPNMTKLVKELESGDLVVRTRSTEDARAVGLTLTEPCRQMMESLDAEISRVDRQVISALNPREMKQLLSLLRKAMKVRET